MPWPDFCPLFVEIHAAATREYQKDNCKQCGVIIGVPLWYDDVDYSDVPHFFCLECFTNTRRCIEHGNIDCRLITANQCVERGNLNTHLALALCPMCNRAFHPDAQRDPARRHYCEPCIDGRKPILMPGVAFETAARELLSALEVF